MVIIFYIFEKIQDTLTQEAQIIWSFVYTICRNMIIDKIYHVREITGLHSVTSSITRRTNVTTLSSVTIKLVLNNSLAGL